MKKRKWYKKKRYWILVILTSWLIFSRLGATNFWYDPALLEVEISSLTKKVTTFNLIPFENSNVAYIKVGDRSASPLVVFVHGSPGSLTAAKNYLIDNRLIRNADVISIDRLGFGYSNYGMAEPSLRRHTDMLFEILKSYQNRKVILVGHSMGAPVLVKYAMDHSDQLTAIVLVAPSISPSLEPSNSWRRALNIAPIRWLTQPAFRVCNQEIIPLKEELLKIDNQWGKIRVPVTIIHGTEDQLVPYENTNYTEAALVNSPNKKIRKVQGGNHFIFWNEHDLIVEEILQLISVLN